jgi:cell division protein FtsQ
MDRPEGFQKKKPGRGKENRRAETPRRGAGVAQKAATKRRVAAQRTEYRRFTAATRHRRVVWGVSVGSIGLVAGLTAVLVLSPALAFQKLEVDGTDLVSDEEIAAALQPLYGEPLARVTAERVAEAFAPMTLIQAFTTRIQPPNTLVVTIIERQPVGYVAGGSGFDVVDAVGVVLWSDQEAPNDMPHILVSPDSESPSFVAVSRVLLALPGDIQAQVEGITATTLDDVRFTIRDRDHEVVWGSAERSVEKARVLGPSLRAAGAVEPRIIDVTTPDSVVIRPRP